MSIRPYNLCIRVYPQVILIRSVARISPIIWNVFNINNHGQYVIVV